MAELLIALSLLLLAALGLAALIQMGRDHAREGDDHSSRS
jgi:hypothetical protein